MAVLAALAGCGGGAPIDWDLSQTHLRRDVDWPSPDLDGTEVEPDGAAVRIRLPHGVTLAFPRDTITRIDLFRKGETLHEVGPCADGLGREEAFRLASRYARRLRLPVAPLRVWRAQPAGDTKSYTTGTRTRPLGGRGGPWLTIYLGASYGRDDPVSVCFDLSFVDRAV